MKCKDAILRYLETHKAFSATEVATEYGISLRGVNQAAALLAKKGVLVFDSRSWRHVFYRLANDDEKSGRRSTNRIFQECRNSDAMKRVLMVWGRVPS